MHPQKLIDTVIQFEKDLAAFYQRLETEERFRALQKIFKFMNEHSDIHAELIRNFRSDAKLPGLDIGPLEVLHERIKTALVEKLTATEDMDLVFEQLAQAEAIVSKVYDTIAVHYRKKADVYSMLSQNFKNLADDEMRHHDHIQKEKELFNKVQNSQSELNE